MNSFLAAYIEAALWSSVDEADGGQFLDRNYSAADISPEALAKMAADCARFESANAETLAELDDTKAGHDFWLTRNGHGAGFWDGDYDKPAASALTQSAQSFGECDLYVGDGGRIHHYPG